MEQNSSDMPISTLSTRYHAFGSGLVTLACLLFCGKGCGLSFLFLSRTLEWAVFALEGLFPMFDKLL
jgi:hypothetical protein